MKQITLICFVIALIASNAAWARGGWGGGGHYGGGHYGGGHYGGGYYAPYYGGVALGLGLGYGLGYYGGYYGGGYPSTTIITAPATPPVYIQQAAPVVQQNPAGYWYYCNNPQGYYPYVKQCNSSWQQVEPTPPPPLR
jgi:hypothetical protein